MTSPKIGSSLKEKRSQYFRELNAKRKNPYLPFKDPTKAREAQIKSVEARKANNESKKTITSKEATQDQDNNQGQQEASQAN